MKSNNITGYKTLHSKRCKNNNTKNIMKAAVCAAALGALGVGIYMNKGKLNSDKFQTTFKKTNKNIKSVFENAIDTIKDNFKKTKNLLKAKAQKVKPLPKKTEVEQKTAETVKNNIETLKPEISKTVSKNVQIPELKPEFILNAQDNQILKAPQKTSNNVIMGLIPQTTTASETIRPAKFINNVAYDSDLNKFSGTYTLEGGKNATLTFKNGLLKKASYKDEGKEIIKEYEWLDSKISKVSVYEPVQKGELYPYDDNRLIKEVIKNANTTRIIEYPGFAEEGEQLVQRGVEKIYKNGKPSLINLFAFPKQTPYRTVDFDEGTVTNYMYNGKRQTIFDYSDQSITDFLLLPDKKPKKAFEINMANGKIKANPMMYIGGYATREDITYSVQEAKEHFAEYGKKYFPNNF